MLFSKSALVFSFLALGNVAVAASSPACLLSALGSTLANPADLESACVKDTDKLQKKIAEVCGGDDLQDALDYYKQTCKDHDYDVEIKSSAVSASSPTGTSTSKKSSTSGFTTATADSSSGSGSSSQTSSGSASSASATQTVSAGSSDRHVSAAAFAAVVFVGFAATL